MNIAWVRRTTLAVTVASVQWGCGREVPQEPDGGPRGVRTETCFRPFSLQDLPDAWAGMGCECGAADEASPYCITTQSKGYVALLCHEGTWQQAFDGPCRPAGSFSAQDCETQGGAPMSSEPNAIARCGIGLHFIGSIDATGQACCAPFVVSVAECTAQGFVALADPGDGSLLAAGCPRGEPARAQIGGRDFDEGGLCCDL